MSEEEYMEECERKYIEQHTTHIKGYTEKYVKDLQQKVEQLEKENKELKEENKHIFSKVNDDELLISNAMNYAEAQEYKLKYEQLENIRKEVIEEIQKELSFVIKVNEKETEVLGYNPFLNILLNILNKGSKDN